MMAVVVKRSNSRNCGDTEKEVVTKQPLFANDNFILMFVAKIVYHAGTLFGTPVFWMLFLLPLVAGRDFTDPPAKQRLAAGDAGKSAVGIPP